MKRNNKKGFTIVELVIVIAVIAILAAVLIPTFSSVIKKAKVNNDIQLVRNLNTALATDTKEHKTMQDALDAAFEFGYDVAKINNTSVDENKILWDSKNDVFCYLKDGALEYVPNSATTVLAANDYRLWTISDTVDGTYSTYYTGSETTINTSKGFDAGTTTGITEIKYENNAEGATPQNVVIRTNGGTLTVKAPRDTVKHYGEAQVVTLTAVGTSSYYEHGSVNLVDIKKGRLVITNDAEAEVGTIYLSATNDAYDGIILATQSESELPEVVARESVSIPTTGEKLVVTIQTNVDANGENPTKIEEIKLYPASDVKEATNGYSVSDLGLLVVEAISPEAQTQAAGQITDAAVLESVKKSNVSTKEKFVDIATMFAGGKGTKDKPYLISNRQQLENISKVNENAAKANDWSTELTGGYFKVADGVKEIDCSDWTSGNLYGHFDGNGVVLNNLNAALFNTVYDFESNIVPFEVSTISNLTANVNIRSTSRFFEGFITNLGWSTSFKNVVLHGYIEAQNAASFVGIGTGYSGTGAGNAIVISFDNCYSDISLVSVSGFSSGFVAHPYWGQGSKMVINDSIYYGRATSTGGNHYYKGNSSNDGTTSLEETYTDGFFSKYGYASIEDLRGTSKTLSANYAVSNKSTTLTVKNDLTKPALGSVFTVKQANGAVKAVAKFVVGPNDVNGKGNYTGVFLIDENLTASNGQFITENVKYYTVTVNGNSTEETGVSGTYFNIVSGSYGTTYTTYMVEIVQYDINGNIICINRCDLR